MRDLKPYVLFENTEHLIISQQEVDQVIGVKHSEASNFIGELRISITESLLFMCIFIDHDRDMIYHNGQIDKNYIDPSVKDYTVEEMSVIVTKMSHLEQWVANYLRQHYEIRALPL